MVGTPLARGDCEREEKGTFDNCMRLQPVAKHSLVNVQLEASGGAFYKRWPGGENAAGSAISAN